MPTPPKLSPLAKHSKQFLVGIHSYRGLAALLVVCHHAYRSLYQHWQTNPFSEWFIGGAAGVQFFFVLSGFIIYYIHHKDIPSKANLSLFLRKRLVRIYPVYWAVLLPVLTLLFIQKSFVAEIPRNFSTVVVNFLLIPPEGPRAIAVSWTLSHEILFYGFFLIAFYLLRRLHLSLVIWSLTILAYGIAQRLDWLPWASSASLTHWLDFFFDINNLFFALGVWTFCLYHRLAKRGSSSTTASNAQSPGSHILPISCLVAGIATFVGILAWQAAQGFVRDYHGFLFWSERIGLAIASCLLLLGEPITSKLRLAKTRTIKILGDASYSIYLVHGITQTFLDKFMHAIGLPSTTSPMLIFLILVTVPTIVGIATHLLVEKPLLRLFGHYLIPKRTQSS